MSLSNISKLLKKTFAMTKKCRGLLKANLKMQKALKKACTSASSSVMSSPSRKKKTNHAKGECTVCAKIVSLTKDGFIHKGHSCEGKGLLPVTSESKVGKKKAKKDVKKDEKKDEESEAESGDETGSDADSEDSDMEEDSDDEDEEDEEDEEEDKKD
jgi:hypothetical protein